MNPMNIAMKIVGTATVLSFGYFVYRKLNSIEDMLYEMPVMGIKIIGPTVEGAANVEMKIDDEIIAAGVDDVVSVTTEPVTEQGAQLLRANPDIVGEVKTF